MISRCCVSPPRYPRYPRPLVLAEDVSMGALLLRDVMEGSLSESVGAAGSVGLLVTSAHRLARQRDTSVRLHAASNLAWGTQSAMLLSGAGSHWMAPACGVGGGLLQTVWAGGEICSALQRKDHKAACHGLLAVAAAKCWILASLGVGGAVPQVGFAVFTIMGKVVAPPHPPTPAFPPVGRVRGW